MVVIRIIDFCGVGDVVHSEIVDEIIELSHKFSGRDLDMCVYKCRRSDERSDFLEDDVLEWLTITRLWFKCAQFNRADDRKCDD